jgi:hypothetical protein
MIEQRETRLTANWAITVECLSIPNKLAPFLGIGQLHGIQRGEIKSTPIQVSRRGGFGSKPLHKGFPPNARGHAAPISEVDACLNFMASILERIPARE